MEDLQLQDQDNPVDVTGMKEHMEMLRNTMPMLYRAMVIRYMSMAEGGDGGRTDALGNPREKTLREAWFWGWTDDMFRELLLELNEISTTRVEIKNEKG